MTIIERPTSLILHAHRAGLALDLRTQGYIVSVDAAETDGGDVMICFKGRKHHDASKPSRMDLTMPLPEAERLSRSLTVALKRARVLGAVP
jgi:hypothetical protein